jgi:hypothetical protein
VEIGTGNAARGDLDDALVVDVAAALHRQVRMIPERVTWRVSSFFGPFLVMKTRHPRREIYLSGLGSCWHHSEFPQIGRRVSTSNQDPQVRQKVINLPFA